MGIVGAFLILLAAILAVVDLADLAKVAELLPLAILAACIGVLLLHGPGVWRR